MRELQRELAINQLITAGELPAELLNKLDQQAPELRFTQALVLSARATWTVR